MNLIKQEHNEQVEANDFESQESSSQRHGHGGPFTCARCGRLEYPNGEFQTIKFGDIFTHLNPSSNSGSLTLNNGATDLCKECQDQETTPPIALPQQSNNVIRYGGPMAMSKIIPQLHRDNNGHCEGQLGVISPTMPNLYNNDGLNQTPQNGSQNSLIFSPIIQHSFHPQQQHQHLFESNHSSVLSYPNNPTPPATNAYLNMTVMSPAPNGASVETKIVIPVQSQSQSTGGVITTTKINKKANPLEVEDKPRVPCSLCKKTFKNDKFAVAHLKRVHEKVNRFVCEICGTGFSYRGSLDSHLSSHNPPAVTHDCPTCGQKFKEKSNLSKHLRYHTENPKKFLCEHCPSGFSKRVNLRYHIRRKHPEVAAAMNLNNNNNLTSPPMLPMDPNNLDKFSEASNPTTPTTITTSTTNSKDKPQGNFKCEQCGRGFLFKNNLKAHLKTHTRDKQYTCDLCQKSFIYKESLKNHMLLHSNELPYNCEICGKKFRDRSNRRKHVKNVHKYLFPTPSASDNGTSSGTNVSPVAAATSEILVNNTSSTTPAPPTKKRNRKSKSVPSSEGDSTSSGNVIKRVGKRNKKIAETETSDTSTTSLNVLVDPMTGPSTSTSNLATKSVIVSMSNVMEGGGRKVIMSPVPPAIVPSYPSLDYNTRPDISGTPFSSLDLAEANNLGTNIIVKTQPVSPFESRASLTQNQMQNVIVYPNKTRPHPQQQLHHHYSSNNLQGYDIPSPEVSSHGQGQQQLGQPPLNNDYSSQSLQLGHYDGSDPSGGIFPHQQHHTQFITPHISSEASEGIDRKPNIVHGVQYSGFYSAPPSDTSSYGQHWSDNQQHPSQGYQQHRLQDSDEQQTQQPSPSQQSIESSSNLIGYPNQNQPTAQQQQQQSNNETFQDPGSMNNGSVFLYRDLSQFDFSYL